MTATADHWNRSHEGIPKDKAVSRYGVEKEKLFPRNTTVMDVGGGTGADSLYFLQQGHSVTLLDISDYALNVAKEKALKEGLKLTIQQTDLSQGRIDQPSKSMKRIYSRLATHYFGSTTTTNLFREIHRVLADDGVAYLTLKSPDDEKEMEFLSLTAEEIEPGVFSEDGKIKSRFTIGQLHEFLTKAGISNFTINPYIEDMGGRVDKIKSGNEKQLFNEIVIKK